MCFPNEIWAKIFESLDPVQDAHVRRVSQRFKNIADDTWTRDDYFKSVAREAAISSTQGIEYGFGYNFHPTRSRIFNLQVTAAERGKFNDMMVQEFLLLADHIIAEPFVTWIANDPVLRKGPAAVHPVQLAEKLSQYYCQN